jgi:poly-gamma-glutamate synthesis protein (capsule biosynthesis protein)
VLFAHWGEEYVPKATARQERLAHAFVDAGADMIIGAHPHIVEPIEIYKNKAIFYSLGNFMFDQYFSYATTHGVAVHVEWGDERTRFTLIPVSIVDEEVKIAEPADQKRILPTLIGENMSLEVSSAILANKEFILWNNK